MADNYALIGMYKFYVKALPCADTALNAPNWQDIYFLIFWPFCFVQKFRTSFTCNMNWLTIVIIAYVNFQAHPTKNKFKTNLK